MPYPLILTRHGRTALNAAGRLRGQLDVALDEVGRAEADALADTLAELRPIRVVTSPLRRAMETAQRIALRADASLVVDEGLADRGYGPWAGTSERAVIAEWGSLDLAPGVESSDAVGRRARSVLDAQSGYLDQGTVVLVSHDAVNRALLRQLNAALANADEIGQRTACWNVITRRGGTWAVLQVDQKVEPAVRG